MVPGEVFEITVVNRRGVKDASDFTLYKFIGYCRILYNDL